MRRALTVVAILLFAMLPGAFASETISIGELVILDEKRTPVKSVNPGDKVSIQSSLQTNNQTQQAFVYIVQVQDLAGYTVFLAWASGTFQNNQTSSISWEPEKEGSFTVQTFVWTSIDSPLPLSFVIQKTIIDVCSGSALCFSGTVNKVVDGDTLDVDDVRVRLALANTPERGQEGYSQATNFTSATCPVGSTVLVDEDDGQTGRSYNRTLAKVYCDNKMLNEELLFANHAVIDTRYCNVSEFAHEDWATKYGC